ncbi:MAG: ROK family protein [bacterium]
MMNEIVLGIDVGGTNTVFGFVDRDGNCISEYSIPTNAQEDSKIYFNRLFEEIKNKFTPLAHYYSLLGIGIGAPNANYYKGTVEQPPNLNWGFVNVVEIVKSYFNIPTVITNDANAAAIGEMVFGAAKEMKNFIVITLGTGVGSGIVANGELIYGSDGFAGEIGHTVVFPDGRDCGCGKKGCLETYLSASGFKRTAFEILAKTNQKSELCKYSFCDLTPKIISEAALNGDRVALETFDYSAKLLGLQIADAVAYTSPEAIIIFGGVAKSGDLLLKPVKKYMEEYLLNIYKNKVNILPSGLQDKNIAVLGAAALIWKELDK